MKPLLSLIVAALLTATPIVTYAQGTTDTAEETEATPTPTEPDEGSEAESEDEAEAEAADAEETDEDVDQTEADEDTEGEDETAETGTADDDDDDDDGFHTGELAEDQDKALQEWEAASRKQAEQQIKRGYYLSGAGVAVAAGAAYFTVAGLGASQKRDDNAATCADLNDPDSAACQNAIKYGKQASTNYALGAALGVAGLTLAAVGAHNVVVGRRVKASLAVSNESAMLFIHGEF